MGWRELQLQIRQLKKVWLRRRCFSKDWRGWGNDPCANLRSEDPSRWSCRDLGGCPGYCGKGQCGCSRVSYRGTNREMKSERKGWREGADPEEKYITEGKWAALCVCVCLCMCKEVYLQIRWWLYVIKKFWL